MTFFDFIVPVIALAAAGVSVLFIQRSGRRLDRAGAERHPAE